MKLTVLGSGTSHGIPVISCDCPVCRSDDPRDKRTRSSLYVEGTEGEKVVIDTGPEFRLQAVNAGIKRLDAIFLTHSHADHLHGLDDIRPLCRDKVMPVYGNKPTIAELKERFSYVFKDPRHGGGKPRIKALTVSGPVWIGRLQFSPIPVKHGAWNILGWKIEEPSQGKNPAKVALYLTDTSAIPPSSLAMIRGGGVLIIDGLRRWPHETHFTFEQALNAALEIEAPRIYLTHICHENSHQAIMEYCEDFKKKRKIQEISIEPAFDGLEISL